MTHFAKTSVPNHLSMKHNFLPGFIELGNWITPTHVRVYMDQSYRHL